MSARLTRPTVSIDAPGEFAACPLLLTIEPAKHPGDVRAWGGPWEEVADGTLTPATALARELVERDRELIIHARGLRMAVSVRGDGTDIEARLRAGAALEAVLAARANGRSKSAIDWATQPLLELGPRDRDENWARLQQAWRWIAAPTYLGGTRRLATDPALWEFVHTGATRLEAAILRYAVGAFRHSWINPARPVGGPVWDADEDAIRAALASLERRGYALDTATAQVKQTGSPRQAGSVWHVAYLATDTVGSSPADDLLAA